MPAPASPPPRFCLGGPPGSAPAGITPSSASPASPPAPSADPSRMSPSVPFLAAEWRPLAMAAWEPRQPRYRRRRHRRTASNRDPAAAPACPLPANTASTPCHVRRRGYNGLFFGLPPGAYSGDSGRCHIPRVPRRAFARPKSAGFTTGPSSASSRRTSSPASRRLIDGPVDALQVEYNLAATKLDKAAARGVIHKNLAARKKKSQLARKLLAKRKATAAPRHAEGA